MSKTQITIVYIVVGVDFPVETNVGDLLRLSRDNALRQSGNTGRPFDDWVIRDDKGVSMPPEQKVERFNFEDGVRLFLMPAAGAGG